MNGAIAIVVLGPGGIETARGYLRDSAKFVEVNGVVGKPSRGR